MDKPASTKAAVAALALAFAGMAQAAPAPRVPVTPPPQTPAAPPATHGAMPPGALGADAIHAAITRAGYTQVRSLKFDDGIWKAKALDRSGRRAKVRVGAMTGKVYPEHASSRLSPADIQAKLGAAGYQRIHDIKFDDGMWKADAWDAQHGEVDVLLDPDDGSVVAVDPD